MLLYRVQQSSNILLTLKATKSVYEAIRNSLSITGPKTRMRKILVWFMPTLIMEMQSSPALSKNGVSKNIVSQLSLHMDIQDYPTLKRGYTTFKLEFKNIHTFFIFLSLVNPIFNHFKVSSPLASFLHQLWIPLELILQRHT